METDQHKRKQLVWQIDQLVEVPVVSARASRFLATSGP
jgi:hypothetical protein